MGKDWGKDSKDWSAWKDRKESGKSSGKGKGKGKGKRDKNVDVEAVLGVLKEISPEELERRKKRMGRFGTTKEEEKGDQVEPDAAEVAEKLAEAAAPPEIVAASKELPKEPIIVASPRKRDDGEAPRGMRAGPDEPWGESRGGPRVANEPIEDADKQTRLRMLNDNIAGEPAEVRSDLAE